MNLESGTYSFAKVGQFEEQEINIHDGEITLGSKVSDNVTSNIDSPQRKVELN